MRCSKACGSVQHYTWAWCLRILPLNTLGFQHKGIHIIEAIAALFIAFCWEDQHQKQRALMDTWVRANLYPWYCHLSWPSTDKPFRINEPMINYQKFGECFTKDKMMALGKLEEFLSVRCVPWLSASWCLALLPGAQPPSWTDAFIHLELHRNLGWTQSGFWGLGIWQTQLHLNAETPFLVTYIFTFDSKGCKLMWYFSILFSSSMASWWLWKRKENGFNASQHDTFAITVN